MQTEITSDTDQSKQSLSPKFACQHGELSELSFFEDNTSPAGQRIPKSYRKMRPQSAPRAYVTETNIWREFSLPSYCMPDYRRTPAMYIEQDIINKQRQEIQLLMEELGNRDQELTDLVMSHQKQVKAWECDNEKNRVLQAKLTHYEDELRSKEEQLKRVLAELANVNDQREVDVKELKKTQSEMIKLTDRIMENSLYIKEMEAQNQKLNSSLRDFASIKQAFRAREQELVSLLKEKEFRVSDKQQELDKQNEYIKVLESQCRELGERNNNMNEDSINWRKKYSLLKEETERLNDDCRKKEENIQKMTQQLHESLQQAIALQKALFTSCEREKCKEEVMYSLRRQHKRTMQELQNIRELYDRLTRDTTLYHLSIKDKEFSNEGKRSEEEYYEEDGKKKKHIEHIEKWHHDSRRKSSIHLSVNKHKHLEGNSEGFLPKESKERKFQGRESKHRVMSEEDSVENNTEEEDKNGNVSTNHNRITDKSNVRATKDASQRISPNVTSSRLKNGLDSNKVGFTNQTSTVDAGCSKLPAKGFGTRSRNSESRTTKSPCHSPLSDSSEKSQKANPVNLQDVVGDVTPETAAIKHDDKSQKETSHKDPTAQPQGSTAYESKPSRTMTVSRKDDLAKREQEERQFHTSDEPAAATKQLNKKKSVEFDVPDKMITSCNRQMQAESHCMCSESDCHLQQAHDRQDSSTANSSSACQNKCQHLRQQADGVSGGFPLEREEKRKNSPMKMCEDSLQESKSSDKECSQRVEKWQHELGQDCRPRESENPETEFKMKPMEMHEHQLRQEVCDQCRARGRRVCDCSRTPRSCVAHSKPLTVTFAPEVSSSDKSYPCQQEPVSLTSKFSFMEMDSQMDYGSSMRESDNCHAQEFSTREFSEGPLTYPPMTMLKNPPSHQSSKKIHFSLPSVDSFYNQNQHHKTTYEDLPDEVSAYLARQRCFRPEMYYNNNNRSGQHLHDPTMAADSSDSDHQSCNGQSLSKSGQALSSNGQSEIRPVSDEKPQRTVVSKKEESVFVQENGLQKNRLQKQDHFRNERRENMLEVGNKDVTDNYKRHDDNTNRCEDCGKTSSDAIQRFDVKRFGGNYKRSDVENKCGTSNKRSSDDSHRRADDSLRRFDDTQRRSDDNRRRCDDNKPRVCCENRGDNSANNSNRKSATCCSQSMSCDMRAAVAREKTQSDSKHGLPFLKKMQHSQEKKLDIRGEFHYEPASQETQNDVRNSAKGSYFCPEESEPENEGCANSQSLADDKKAPLAHVSGHVSLELAQFKTGRDLLLQKHTSWHPSEMPQVVQTILPSTNRDGSEAQNDKSGTNASLEQVESDCRSCEMKGKSGVTTISGRGRSDSRFCVLEGSNTMSSRPRNSRSCELDGRSAGVLSSTQKQLEPRTFEQDGDSFSLYSPQEQLNNQSLQLKSRSDVTSRDQEGSSSDNLEPKDRTGNTVSSIHKQANNGFCDQHHTTRKDSDNSKHDTSIRTLLVIVGQCESPYSGNTNQQHMSSDQSSGEMSTGSVSQRSCSDSLEAAHHSFRNCCFSSEIVKSNFALRSDKSCVLGRDIENANKNNNADICSCSHENCLCSG